MAVIGCKDLHYAKMADVEKEIYENPVALKKLKQIDIVPKVDTVNNFYDDHMGETIATMNGITVTIQLDELTNKEVEDLLGATVDTKGVLIQKGNDAAPYVALMFRSMKSDQVNFRYKCLYKGKFTLPQDTAKTKGEKVELQTKTIIGQFMPLDKNNVWQASIDTDNVGADTAKVIEDWFKSPYMGSVSA